MNHNQFDEIGQLAQPNDLESLSAQTLHHAQVFIEHVHAAENPFAQQIWQLFSHGNYPETGG